MNRATLFEAHQLCEALEPRRSVPAMSASMSDPYRGGDGRRRPYDPALRVRPCDACGAGLVVGEAAEIRSCEACGHAQRIPAATPLAIERGAARDEAARIAHLATQLDHQWLMPRSVARYGNVLEGELDEARAVWAKIRQRVEEGDESEEALTELVVMTYSLNSGMPATSDAERLARRAVIEASAETVREPALRQKLLGNMITGAVRAGAVADARAWLERLDPKSDNLDADSMYRIGAALLATNDGDVARVIDILGRKHGDVPIHKSAHGMVAVLRANALEKLGSLEDAAAGLYDQIRRSHSSLALIQAVIANLPRDYALCEKALPLAIARDHERLAKNVFLPRSWLGPALILAAGVLATGSLIYPADPFWPGAGAAVALFVIAVATLRAQRRERIAIIAGCKHVDGRILAVRPAPNGKSDLDVVVERPGGGEARVTTRQALAADILEMNLVGASFDALWNPDHPEHFPRITINVSADDYRRARGSQE